jgi:hypothetical protein
MSRKQDKKPISAILEGSSHPARVWGAGESFVIEKPQCPKLYVFGVVVVTKGEMPAPLEGAIHYLSLDLVNSIGLACYYLRV